MSLIPNQSFNSIPFNSIHSSIRYGRKELTSRQNSSVEKEVWWPIATILNFVTISMYISLSSFTHHTRTWSPMHSRPVDLKSMIQAMDLCVILLVWTWAEVFVEISAANALSCKNNSMIVMEWWWVGRHRRRVKIARYSGMGSLRRRLHRRRVIQSFAISWEVHAMQR